MADARKRPGKVSMGMLSNKPVATAHDLLEEGQRLRHEPDLLQGRRDRSCRTGSPASPTCRNPPPWCRWDAPRSPAGKLRALATTGEKRSFALPDTPDPGRAGAARPTRPIRGGGSMRRRETPKPVIDRMHAELTKAVRSPDVTKKFVDQIHLEIDASTPEEFARLSSSCETGALVQGG